MKISGKPPTGPRPQGQATPGLVPATHGGAASSATGGESVLERRYPGVVRALVLMWGYPELTEFLERVALGLDERLRDIEPAAMAELMVLTQVHRSFCAGRTPQSVESHPAQRNARGWQPALKPV